MMRTPILMLLVAMTLPALRAQPQAAGGSTVSVQYSGSAGGDLTRAGVAAGDVEVRTVGAAWRTSFALTPATQLEFGVNWESFDFDRSTLSGVPDTLQETSIVLGAAHRVGSSWRLTATTRPGFYGDDEGRDGDAFNAPMLLLAMWRQSPELGWAFGLRVDWLSERAVIPLVGVNWKFAPDWEFVLGMPKAGVSYQANDALKLTLGASVQGGNFHVARDPRTGGTISSTFLQDTTLDYHEIRVGLAADWKLNERFSILAEAGVITDQKFDYFDRGYTLDGGGIGFFTVGLTGRF
jgi:hypothetical protein